MSRGAALRPDGGLVARGARRRRLGHGLPQRGLLRAAAGGARRRRPPARVRDRHDALGPARPPAARPRRDRVPPRVRGRPLPALAAAHAHADQLCEGARAAARRLVRGGLGRPGAPRLGRRVRRSPPAGPPTSPERRLQDAALGPLSPPGAADAQRHWSTYPAVPLPSADAAIATLSDPSRWPDFGCALGRFTALRGGGLAGQTFEIEVVAHPAPRTPVFTRGYVTATGLARRIPPRSRRARPRRAGRAGAARRAPRRGCCSSSRPTRATSSARRSPGS